MTLKGTTSDTEETKVDNWSIANNAVVRSQFTHSFHGTWAFRPGLTRHSGWRSRGTVAIHSRRRRTRPYRPTRTKRSRSRSTTSASPTTTPTTASRRSRSRPCPGTEPWRWTVPHHEQRPAEGSGGRGYHGRKAHLYAAEGRERGRARELHLQGQRRHRRQQGRLHPDHRRRAGPRPRDRRASHRRPAHLRGPRHTERGLQRNRRAGRQGADRDHRTLHLAPVRGRERQALRREHRHRPDLHADQGRRDALQDRGHGDFHRRRGRRGGAVRQPRVPSSGTIGTSPVCNPPFLLGGAKLLGGARKIVVGNQFRDTTINEYGYRESGGLGSMDSKRFTTTSGSTYEIDEWSVWTVRRRRSGSRSTRT